MNEPIADPPCTSSSIFPSTDGLGYTLQNNHRAAARLNLQQYLWHETLGYHIHPGVQIPAFSPVIADVATGTGLWMIQVAREVPSAQVDGLDIDMTQAPHPAWLPGAIGLRYWDIFSPVPPDLREKYDLVHVRLLVLVLSGVDPVPAIRNLLALLKPGGYLQWDELDCVHMKLKKADESLVAPALEEIQSMLYATGRHNWALELPRTLTDCGFEDAWIDYYDEAPELVRAFNDQHLMTIEEFAGKLAQLGQVETAREVYDLVKTGYEESVQGVALSVPRVVVVARKPMISSDQGVRSNRRPLESL
ncbi:UMTA methyltransferase family protein [Aspergillus steynii IBT 23096]|uniref:UMTA methyltransferase family protein n=1 Tax=Aspergillus steynii IBT 23096 TaxID=1392250 RepID=A0A2I2G067_9EURO|nr:UMTA methyltransferase family protein [Aspergillus steynii IBT 23096]PLB46270.1 UMTA methyltransferase family protein [Aspergillus steynii IBT 23096]